MIDVQAWQVLSGCAVGPCAQLMPLARMRASDVLPVPRGPANRYAWRTLSLLDRVREGAHDRFLPDDFSERLRAVLPVERGHGSIQADPGRASGAAVPSDGCVYLAGVHGSPGPHDLLAPWTDDPAAHAGRQRGRRRRRDRRTRSRRAQRRAGLGALRSTTAGSRSRATGRCSRRSVPAVRADRKRATVHFTLARPAHVELRVLSRNAPRSKVAVDRGQLGVDADRAGERPVEAASRRTARARPGSRRSSSRRRAPTRCSSSSPGRPGSRRCTARRRRRTRICRGRRSCGCSGSTPPSCRRATRRAMR